MSMNEQSQQHTTSISKSPHREAVRELIKEHYDRGDTTGWFEALYAWAGDDSSKVPWSDKRPNKKLLEWLSREQIRGNGRSAIVVGCGLGDDADLLAKYGFKVTAFDLSNSAIEWCRRRFGRSNVKFVQADLLAAPKEWIGAFDFVFEAYTIQALPRSLRDKAIDAIASLVKPGGELLVICRGCDENEEVNELPWPLPPSEVARFDAQGLKRLAFEDFLDDEDPPIRRFRVLWRRPVSG
jgi:SAM-dependent methyltransferase